MKISGWHISGCLALLLGGLLGSPPVFAADLQVTPTSIEFSPGDQSQRLWLINSGNRTLQAQVRLFHWTQTLKEDVLQPSQAFALSPAMVSVAPGQRQLVRVIRRQATEDANEAVEGSFRILVDELPVARESGEPPGVQFVFRYSIPLFVSHNDAVKEAPAAKTTWMYKWIPGGLSLRVRNSGSQHIQISGLSLETASQKLSVHEGLFGYVLAGQTREWQVDIEDSVKNDITRIKATINGQETTSRLVDWSDTD